jgi:hypothetical protein
MHIVSASGLARRAFGSPAIGADRVVAAQAGTPTEERAAAGERTPLRLLHIGDAHTAGAYGAELHRLLAEAGIAVATLSSTGSPESVRLNDTVTGCRLPALDPWAASEDFDYEALLANWLRDVVDAVRPEVLVFSLGADQCDCDDAFVRREVGQFARAVLASESGRTARWIWVGPSNTRRTVEAPDTYAASYESLRAAVVDQGADFIDSRPLTPTYAGRDGIHFDGEQGIELAKRWAAGVFAQLCDLGV